MSFSKSPGRFERPVAASSPGPGTYDRRVSADESITPLTAGRSARLAGVREEISLPSTAGMEDFSDSEQMTKQEEEGKQKDCPVEDERGSECSSQKVGCASGAAAAGSIVAVVDKVPERCGNARATNSVTKQRPATGVAEKENRLLPSQRASVGTKRAVVRPQSPQAVSAVSELSLITTASEEKEKHEIRKLLGRLGMVGDELEQKRREGKDLQRQVAAKDQKLKEFQRKIEDLIADRREAHQRTAEAEAERDAKRRALHDKEQDLIGLQRKHEHMLRTIEDRGKRLERTQDEHGRAVIEAQTLQDRYAAAERERKALDQTVRQQQRRMREAEEGYKSHLAGVEESLRRESDRRLELEALVARSGAEAHHGGNELSVERQRADDLQSRLTELEAEHRVQRLANMEKAEQHHNMEVELVQVRAQAAAQADALTRAQEHLKEVRERASKAEVKAEASARQLAGESVRLAELEEEVRRFGEAKVKALEERFAFSESRSKQLEQDWKDERERADELERCAAGLERAGDIQTFAHDDAQRRVEVSRQDFEMRALRAEARAEAAAEDLRKWKDWADEQSLREITAETQRLEELKRVREDLSRQVEEARRDVVEENVKLQQQLMRLQDHPELASARTQVAELEVALERQADELTAHDVVRNELQALEADLQVQLRNAKREADGLRTELEASREALRRKEREAEEERRGLDARTRRAEAEASEAVDELAEEREKFEARVKALRVENEAALEARNKEFATTHSTEREAASKRIVILEECLDRERGRLRVCRWQALVEAVGAKQLCVDRECLWTDVRRAACTWRILSRGHERDEDRLRKQDAELARLDGEAEELREQNRQLLASVLGAQAEQQANLAELRRLQQLEAVWERDVLRINEQNAELGGHVNPKQKIRHLVSLKNQIETLRLELRRCKQHNAQLEGQLRSAQFFDVGTGVQPVGGGAGGGSVSGAASVSELSVSSARPQRSPTHRSAEPPQPLTPGRTKAPSAFQYASRTPGRTSPAPEREQKLTRSDILVALVSADDRPEAFRRDRLEALRHARSHRRASERAVTEYQHLAVLVEQILAHGPAKIAGLSGTTGSQEQNGGVAVPSPMPENALGKGGDNVAYSKASCDTLLHRVRDLHARLVASPPRGEALADPALAKVAFEDGCQGAGEEAALGLEDAGEVLRGAVAWSSEPEDEASLAGAAQA
eukprot:TRINITY_DN68765_c0_g1_i1.p1 TRINITY_DN68765_c0_g1~~TRINITY_DN68765_c0_g1_i1.p1  ORF type:complete len:1201 (+),score=280.63 TRINITY_DN68765_c0_g1_i1:85-3687(+)